jgi:hypothetical protein
MACFHRRWLAARLPSNLACREMANVSPLAELRGSLSMEAGLYPEASPSKRIRQMKTLIETHGQKGTSHLADDASRREFRQAVGN